MFRVALFPLLLLFTFGFAQSYPKITGEGLDPNDDKLFNSIDESKEGELTIASFNIRDVKGTTRTLEDFQALADLIDEADIVVFQEIGAKGFKKQRNEPLYERIQAMIAVFKVYLGEEWEFVLADDPTPSELGMGSEIPLLAYRKESNGMKISAKWSKYYDLGERRDMGLFKVKCSKGRSKENFTIGTVHTKPTCPGRSEELLKIGEYIEKNEGKKYVIMGDFNWGYYSCETGFSGDKYEGEKALEELHEGGKVFQLFHEISYNGNGNDDDFRTNLDLRSKAHLYDQIFLCNTYADKLSDGGKLTQDCGFIVVSSLKQFGKWISKEAKTQVKGIVRGMKKIDQDPKAPENYRAIAEMTDEIKNSSKTVDEASYHLSDHKPIWIQLKLF